MSKHLSEGYGILEKEILGTLSFTIKETETQRGIVT